MQQHTERTFEGKPILAVLLKKGRKDAYPFNIAGYRESYFDFFKLAQRYFSIFVVRGAHTYLGKGAFAGGYHYMKGRLRRWNGVIHARVIYYKDVDEELPYQRTGNWAVVNDPRLVRLLKYKDRTYAHYHRFMKTMWRVKNKQECTRAVGRIRGQMAVFKPVAQYGGKGVVIARKQRIVQHLRAPDGLMGEFIDTSGGIPGLTPSYHDLRVVIMNGKIVETFIRVPKPGSLVSNFARGGTCHYFPINKIPERVRTIANFVDRQLLKFGHRIYSIDFGFERGTPYIIEMNDMPGLPFKSHDPESYKRWHRNLLSVLRKAMVK